MAIIRNSIIYIFSSLISKASPFLLMPFLTSYLEPAEFGMLSIFLVMNALYGAFIGMALDVNVAKNFFKKTKPQLALITGNIFFILLATTVLYFVLSLIIVSLYDSFFSIPSNYLLILPFLSFFAMANQIHLAVLRSEGRAYTFGAFEVANAFFSLAITLVFLIYLEMGWLSQVIGIATASLVLSVIGVGYLYRRGYLNLSFKKVETISILKLSIPLIPHVLGGVVISVSDRLFIERMVGLDAVALYAIGYSFGMVVSLFTKSLLRAWSPWFYQQLVNPTHEHKFRIVKSTYLYLICVFVVAYAISVLGEFILPYIVDESFTDAAEYIWWIALGYAVYGVYQIFFPYLVYISKTGFLAFSTVTAAIINLFFNYLLIPEYGALGAAYATILAFTVSALLVFEYQRRNFRMPWMLRKIK